MYEPHLLYCWRCKSARTITDGNGKVWACPVCDPNLPPDVYASRHKVNPVPPSEEAP